jgi:hypothetical protein
VIESTLRLVEYTRYGWDLRGVHTSLENDTRAFA